MWNYLYKGNIAMLLAAFIIPASAVWSSEAPAVALMQLTRPLVIGHRGYCAAAPENTLPSFRLALSAGADLVELDYHHSKDGIPIVIHDYELDRTSDATTILGRKKVRVDSLLASDMSQFDAGKWFHPTYAGTCIPTLEQALDLIQKSGMTLIERKGGDAATLAKLLNERQLVNRLIVQSFDWSYLRQLHQIEPRQVLGSLGPPSTRNGKKLTDEEKVLNVAWVTEIAGNGSQVSGWNRQISDEGIKYAHKQGLKVWVYTINDPLEIEQLVQRGVDGIISDNPAIVWRTLALQLKNTPLQKQPKN